MRYSISTLLLVIILCTSVWAQPEIIRMRDEGIPFFYSETGNIAAKDSSLSGLFVNVKIPYDELQFLRVNDTLFQAEVEFTFLVFDKDDDQVMGKSFREKVNAENFDQTNTNQIFYSFHTKFNLEPAEYSFLCEVTDMDSKKTGRQKKKVLLRDFSEQKLNVSDLILMSWLDFNEEIKQNILDDFSEIIDEESDFLVATFEVYSPNETQEFDINYSLINFRNKGVQEGKFSVPNDGFASKLYIPLLKSKLAVGNYILKLKIKDGTEKIDVERTFRTHIANLPLTIGNIDQAIEQLRYFADKSDINRMKKAPDDKKQALFNEYWKKIDPTPGTETNELMDEYYRRIAYSNSNFSAYRDGWKTDMGMLYILFGPPNDVDRNPYNVNIMPTLEREVYAYETWYYHEINQAFFFVDERGFGDFRLVNPQDMHRYRE